MDLEIRHVRILLALADELSFTRTAARLGIPQAALSTQISRIERQLGVELFSRTTRTVAPTDALKALLPLARAVETAMHEFEESARKTLPGPRPPTLRIGTQTFPGSVAVDRLLREYPGLVIVQTVHDTESNIVMLRRGELDVLQGCELPESPLQAPQGIRVAAVAEEPLWLVMHQDHRLPRLQRIGIGELRGEVWLDDLGGTAGRDLLLIACREAGFTPDVRYRTNSNELVARLLRGGHCVGLTSPVAPCPADCVMRPLDVDRILRIVLAWNPGRCPRGSPGYCWRACAAGTETKPGRTRSTGRRSPRSRIATAC